MPDITALSSSSYEYFDDPLFLSQSDQPTASLVTSLFRGHDFLGWRREAFMAQTSKNKDSFVDGTSVKPPKTDKKHSQWVHCDFMVRQWILNSLVPSIKDSLKYVNSAKELWSELLERYDQSSALEVYLLKKELEGVAQDNSSLVGYYGKMKNLWETLDGLDPLPLCSYGKIDQCTCSLLKKMIDRENTAKLIQFLMGLNGGYDTFKALEQKKHAGNYDKYCDHCFPNDKEKGTDKVTSSQSGVSGITVSSKNTANAADVLGFDSPLDNEVLASASAGCLANTFHPDNSTGIVPSSSVFVVHKSFVLNDWIIDTEALDHMTYNLKILTDVVTLLNPIKVGLPDGSVKLVHQTRKVRLTDRIKLVNVFYIPDFKQNLMSVSKLIDYNDCSVLFNSNDCVFQDHSRNLVIGKGQRVADLYRFHNKTNSTFITNKVSKIINKVLDSKLQSVNNKSSCSNVVSDSLSLMHNRLGHLSVNKLKFVPSMKAAIKQDFSCEVCILAKHHRLPFSICNKRAVACFDLLNIDVWGPYKVPSISRAKYFLTILYDYSRNTWTILFQNKVQVPGLFKDFLAYILTQFNKIVKTVRSDNDTEFLQQYCSELFKSKGIVHRTSIVGTHSIMGELNESTYISMRLQGL
ncbi:uncharacterized protein LOC141627802 [Silene latifolia]|uniref:uncharacterized protein LOC141627802 n=1 Tax=Silene latifolia TaxID=37657 RepID=UPI003D78B036